MPSREPGPARYRLARAAAGTRPVLVGEVLYDIFPDGTEVLGGAPFNVAWNLQGLGCPPVFISRIGRDPRGGRIVEAMRAWGMETSGVQVDRDHATGTVRVHMESEGHSFEIVADRAWDFVDPAAALHQARSAPPGMLYRGTLAARSEPTRAAIKTLAAAVEAPVLVDLNLRPPWWDPAAVEAACTGAAVVKLNDEELAAVEGGGSDGDAALAMLRRFDLGLVVVTRGSDGATAVTAEGEVVHAPAGTIERLVDTVGAGDAFAAVLVLGLSRGWPIATILTRAAGFAARVCAIRGATTTDRRLYDDAVGSWGGEDARS